MPFVKCGLDVEIRNEATERIDSRGREETEVARPSYTLFHVSWRVTPPKLSGHTSIRQG